MTLGQKIKKLRVEKGLTQKDLADKVYVTFQTVSKWEKDENEPDVSTLRELSKVFDCSLDYLLSEEDSKPQDEQIEPTPVVVPVQEVTKTVVIHQKELHVCTRCQKDIPENELVMEKFCVRSAGRGHSAEYRDDYYHKECLELTKKERKEKADREVKEAAAAAKKKTFKWSIIAAVIALAFFLLVFLVGGKGNVHPALGVLYAFIWAYVAFATVYCILGGSYISEIFVDVSTWSVRFPGVIFTLDLEGLIFLIFVKLLFAVLGALLSLFVLLLATAISAVLSAVSFPFVLIHNTRTNYINAL